MSQNDLWGEIIDYDNLHRSFMATKERYTIESAEFEKDLEGNLIELQNRLIWNEYKFEDEPFLAELVRQAVSQILGED
jgi:hypothetical protein